MTDFSELIVMLHERLTRCGHEAYPTLLSGDKDLSEVFYSFFGLSGAALAAAEPQKRSFVLLQEGKEAVDPHMGFSIPILKTPNETLAAPLQWRDNVRAYNYFCNRIFQAQRHAEGAEVVGKLPVLRREPDFLTCLEKEPGADGRYKAEDWHVVQHVEMKHALLAWRWLHRIGLGWGVDHSLGQDVETYHSNGPLCRSGLRYFSKEHIAMFGDRFMPEIFINRLDAPDAWSNEIQDFPFHATWTTLRSQLDDFEPTIEFFRKDWERITNIYGLTDFHSDLGTIHRWIWTDLLLEKSLTVAEAISRLHSHVHAPIPSYYYLVVSDGRPKRHAVIPLLRSDKHPFEYIVANRTHTHTSLIICVAVLESGEHALGPDMRLLKAALRICIDNVLSSIYVNGLISLEQAKARESSERVLAATAYSKVPGVFILGTFDEIVSFYSQQCRALMLVHALHEVSILPVHPNPDDKTDSVGIVGGGVTGLTAAVACAALGCRVYLYETDAAVLTAQRGATHRYIHPHLVQWPNPRSYEANTALPFLNWDAAIAPNVLDQISSDFDNLPQNIKQRISVVRSRTVQRIFKTSLDTKVSLQTHQSSQHSHRIVIVSVGYGLEKEYAPIPSVSYWMPDKIADDKPDGYRIAIVGNGDGALIDLARAALRDPFDKNAPFDHANISKWIMNQEAIISLGQNIERKDRMLWGRRVLREESNLAAQYENCFEELDDESREGILQAVRDLHRPERSVYWIHRKEQAYRIDTAIVNKVLAFLMVKAQVVTQMHVPDRDSGSATNWKHDPGTDIYTVKGPAGDLAFNLVIPRTGIDKKYITKIEGLEGAHDELGVLVPKFRISTDLDDIVKSFFQNRYQVDTQPRAG